MAGIQTKIGELADLMDEFRLSEAEMEGDGWKVGFRRRAAVAAPAPAASSVDTGGAETATNGTPIVAEVRPEIAETPAGEPLESPMNGIYYSSPSPNAPPFVKPGEEVEEGQVLALIEAMKVFNEIVAQGPARVSKVVAQNSQLVQPGDILMYLEPIS